MSTKIITITKEGHEYRCRYRDGQEADVLRWVLALAKSSDYNIDYTNVVTIVKRIRDGLITDLKGY